MIKNSKIDIIIPVYNGLKYLPKLFEGVFKNTNLPFRLIVIDDASPDEKVWEFLQKIKSENTEKEILLFQNKSNLGFVKTVNRAVEETQNHFVLLNTDVEVPQGWLGRLMYPILSLENIASSTPFTNSGTICSFPKFVVDNEIFEGLNVSELDKYFQKVETNGNFIELPTGVGFCMAFNKKIVDEIGMFDEDAFGKGYGEENDWCQRAIKMGYKNVIVPNLFVYHKHGGSFPSEEKKRLIEENLKKLSQKHSNYLKDVEKFIQKDPLKDVRDFLIFLISSSLEADNFPIILFDHELGGGANFYRENFIKKGLDKGWKIILITYSEREAIFHLKYYFKDYLLRFFADDFEDIVKMIDFTKIREIVLNQLVSYADQLEIIAFIEKKKVDGGVDVTILTHDYYSICPSVMPIDSSGHYCNMPDTETCRKCLALNNNEFSRFVKEKNASKWRMSWASLYSKSDKIICFSESSKKILLKLFPEIGKEKIFVIPHEVDYVGVVELQKKKDNQIIVGILGGISQIKGALIVKGMSDIINREKKNIKLVIMGEITSKIDDKNIIVTGKYDRKELPLLVAKYGVDIFLVPSIIPETFSYTTEEIIKMDMPIAVFNLGAPAERVAKYKKGIIIPSIDARMAIEHIEKLSNKL